MKYVDCQYSDIDIKTINSFFHIFNILFILIVIYTRYYIQNISRRVYGYYQKMIMKTNF